MTLGSARRWWLVALGAATLCTACVPSIGPAAAQALSCTEDKVTDRFIGLANIVEGCGRTDVLYWDGALGRYASLRERAAFELDCPRDSLELTVLDQATYGVKGCDHRLVYKVVWGAGFVLDSVSTPPRPLDAPAEPAPVP